MSKIKGAILMESVRLIRDNKDRDWTKYLTDDDQKVVFGSIMPSNWYPIEIYEHTGNAIFKEFAQGKLENARIWGKFVMEDLGKRFYHNLVKLGDPLGAMERCKTFLRQWFQFDDPDFQAIEVEKASDNQVKVTVRYDHGYDFFEAYTHQLGGMFERIIELNGGKEVKVQITEKDYGTQNPYAVLMINWK